jgi:hypothetical protein
MKKSHNHLKSPSIIQMVQRLCQRWCPARAPNEFLISLSFSCPVSILVIFKKILNAANNKDLFSIITFNLLML